MTSPVALAERDDHFGPSEDSTEDEAVLELTALALEVNGSRDGLTYYFSRSNGGDAKIRAFAQAILTALDSGDTK